MLYESFLHLLCVFICFFLSTFIHHRDRLLYRWWHGLLLSWVWGRVSSWYDCWGRRWIQCLLFLWVNGSLTSIWLLLAREHWGHFELRLQSCTILEQVELLHIVILDYLLLGLAQLYYHRFWSFLHGLECASDHVVLSLRMMSCVCICEHCPARQADLWVHLGDDWQVFWLFQESEDLHLPLESIGFDFGKF